MKLWKAWHHLPSALVKAQATLDMIILAKWISSDQANDELAKKSRSLEVWARDQS